MVNLSKRMLMNVSMIPKGSRVADIGCDHGWVSIYLIEQNIAEHVVAMDVADGPLAMAKAHVDDAGLSDRITIRLSDGLCQLKMDESGNPEAEIVLIAGMGGHLAIRLLEQSIDKCRKMKYIILQIQSDIEFVRNRIRELGFCINDEAMVLDEGKYYTAIRIVPVSNSEIHSYSEKELRYGPVLLKKRPDILKEYLRFKRDGYESIASKISANAKSIDVSEKTADIIREIEIIDECLEDF